MVIYYQGRVTFVGAYTADLWSLTSHCREMHLKYKNLISQKCCRYKLVYILESI